MKKFIVASLAGIAAVAATMSFAPAANAEVVLKYRDHRPHTRVIVRPRAHVVVRPRARVYVAPRVVYRADDCYTKKVRRVTDRGNVVIKRVRVCR